MIYRILSALLSYPEAELIEAVEEIHAALHHTPDRQATLDPLLQHLSREDLISLQETYVATFDRNPGHSLHMFEHVLGESRDRGQAMVDLLGEYRRHGFEPADTELPDYVPLFLEFLGQIDEGAAQKLLDEAIHVLAAIGERLAKNGSPYAAVFTVLRGLTDVEPATFTAPPVRDMDEALETFGPAVDGQEPLLTPAQKMAQTQTITFHPRRTPGAAACA